MIYTVSLICTVRDEADNIADLLDSMLAQVRAPDEIIINDCLSRDATPDIVRAYAERYPYIRLVYGGHNIASGRNNAIAAATGNLIACTDAGLQLDRHWLARILAPLEDGTADHVGGFFQALPQSTFEWALAATNYRHATEINPQRFLPFGKSMAFRRQIWSDVGGFPEWLDHCEDVVFDLAIRRAGYHSAFVPEALVYFRPRHSLRAFARQYYLYARGDGRAGLFPRRHAIRYATYSSMLLLLTVAVSISRARLPVGLVAGLGVVAYTARPCRRLWAHRRTLSPLARLYALMLVPLIRLVGDLAKMIGYPIGVWRRMQARRTES